MHHYFRFFRRSSLLLLAVVFASLTVCPAHAQSNTLTARYSQAHLDSVHTQIRSYQATAPYQRPRVRMTMKRGICYAHLPATRTSAYGDPQRRAIVAVLCPADQTPERLALIQTVLKRKGYPIGEADGVWGHHSIQALTAYQHAKGLAWGILSVESLIALQIPLPSRTIRHHRNQSKLAILQRGQR